MKASVNIHYHKCEKCIGYYFMPCGCSIGNTWCVDCKPHQEILKQHPMPEVDLNEEKNEQVILAKLAASR